MGHSFTANNRESLAAIGKALFYRTKKRAVAEEYLQMTRFLECLATTDLLDYPLKVEHTHEAVPDYQILAGSRTIAVELSRITNQNLGHALAFHNQHGKSVLMTGRLVSSGSNPLPKSELLQKAYCISPTDFGPDLDEECRIWGKTVLEMIDRKSAKHAKETFQHGEEDWLVLRDELGTLSAPMFQLDDDLLPWLHEQVKPRWQSAWFTRVFIQENDFQRTWMLTKKGVSEITQQAE